MAQLLLRDVPEHIADALAKRAAENGRNAEADDPRRPRLAMTVVVDASGRIRSLA